MAEQHFPPDRLDELRTAVLEILGYDPITRNALLATLPTSIQGAVPGGMSPPAIGLTLDLNFPQWHRAAHRRVGAIQAVP